MANVGVDSALVVGDAVVEEGSFAIVLDEGLAGGGVVLVAENATGESGPDDVNLHVRIVEEDSGHVRC